jgi:hypothetical protein
MAFTPLAVMPGLAPGIHVFEARMAGTSPAMTKKT